MSFLDRLKRIFGGHASNGHGHPHDHGSVTCQEALAQLYDYLDGELEGVPEDQVLFQHKETPFFQVYHICRSCRVNGFKIGVFRQHAFFLLGPFE